MVFDFKISFFVFFPQIDTIRYISNIDKYRYIDTFRVLNIDMVNPVSPSPIYMSTII